MSRATIIPDEANNPIGARMSETVPCSIHSFYHNIYHPDARGHGTTFHGSEDWVSVRRGTLHFSDEKMRRIKLKDADTHLYQSKDHMSNYIDCIRTRKQALSNVDAAVQSDLISHLSNAAIRLKRTIKWDLKKEQIIGDNEAAKNINRKLRMPWEV